MGINFSPWIIFFHRLMRNLLRMFSPYRLSWIQGPVDLLPHNADLPTSWKQWLPLQNIISLSTHLLHFNFKETNATGVKSIHFQVILEQGPRWLSPFLLPTLPLLPSPMLIPTYILDAFSSSTSLSIFSLLEFPINGLSCSSTFPVLFCCYPRRMPNVSII